MNMIRSADYINYEMHQSYYGYIPRGRNSTILPENLRNKGLIGLGYRYYFTDAGYFGLRAKFNFVDYTLNHIIDFTGNPVTMQFIIGILGNVKRNSTLRALQYDLRK